MEWRYLFLLAFPWMYTCSVVNAPDLNLLQPRKEKKLIWSSGFRCRCCSQQRQPSLEYLTHINALFSKTREDRLGSSADRSILTFQNEPNLHDLVISMTQDQALSKHLLNWLLQYPMGRGSLEEEE
jgi:hypothetical protein